MRILSDVPIVVMILMVKSLSRPPLQIHMSPILTVTSMLLLLFNLCPVRIRSDVAVSYCCDDADGEEQGVLECPVVLPAKLENVQSFSQLN